MGQVGHVSRATRADLLASDLRTGPDRRDVTPQVSGERTPDKVLYFRHPCVPNRGRKTLSPLHLSGPNTVLPSGPEESTSSPVSTLPELSPTPHLCGATTSGTTGTVTERPGGDREGYP